ncbi:MAG: porin family protein [Bacteroidota bacterium]
MKKTLSLLIFALLFAAGPLMSQKQLYFGIGGTGLSPLTIHQNTYGIGFFFDEKMTSFKASENVNIGFDFSKHLGLKVELGLTTLGQDYKDRTWDSAVYTRTIKMKYLQIPLLVKFRTSGKVGKFYLMAGPQLNLLSSATQTYNKNGVQTDTNTTTLSGKILHVGDSDIKNRYKSLDIMARLDLGVDIIIAEHLLLNIGLTMAYGLTDINATDYRRPDHTGNYNPSHNAYGGINVGLCYILPIGSK